MYIKKVHTGHLLFHKTMFTYIKTIYLLAQYGTIITCTEVRAAVTDFIQRQNAKDTVQY
jgi:hypothetical protein